MDSVLPLPLDSRRPGGAARSDASDRRESLLWREFAETGSQQTRSKLIERFMPLAYSLAHRYRSQSEPLDDLIQVASLGLMKAVDRFEPDRGVPFTGFATPTILGELRRHFRDRVWTLRLPRSLSELTAEIDHANTELSDQLGHHPSAAEIGKYLAIPVERVLEAQNAAQARRMRSLDMPASSDEGVPPMIETVADDESGYERVESQLASAAADLDERERLVLKLHFEDGLTQQAIGERIGVSQMQVSRISRGALWKLLGALQGETPTMAVPTASRREPLAA